MVGSGEASSLLHIVKASTVVTHTLGRTTLKSPPVKSKTMLSLNHPTAKTMLSLNHPTAKKKTHIHSKTATKALKQHLSSSLAHYLKPEKKNQISPVEFSKLSRELP